jgi:hypothetical protein
MSRRHTMLAYPFYNTDFCAEDAEVLANDLAARVKPCLQDALTDMFFRVLRKRADEAHGKQVASSPEFLVGAGLLAVDLSENVVEDLEDFFAIRLPHDDKGLLDDILAVGKTALEAGEVRDGVLRIPAKGETATH